MSESTFISATQQWVETVVIDLNLCPFAQHELIRGRVRFHVSCAETEEQLLADLHTELLVVADELLALMQWQGVFQIASFHPEYQFAETDPEDVENYTNRSPYPMLHLIREASLQQAIAHYPDVDQIPINNIALLRHKGLDQMRALLRLCYFDHK